MIRRRETSIVVLVLTGVVARGQAPRVLAADSDVVRAARVEALARLAALSRDREPVLGDPVDLAIEAPAIVWMFSSGHGRMLTVGRLEASASGAVDRRLTLSPSPEPPRSAFPNDNEWSVAFTERDVTAGELERLVAMVATILDSSSTREHVLPSDPSKPITLKYDSTSNDLGAWVLLTGAGRVREAAFHGYVSSLNEERRIAPSTAVDVLRSFGGATPRSLEIDDEARSHFDVVFPLLSAAWSDSWWFEQERACVLGGRVRSRAMIGWAFDWAEREPSDAGHGARLPYHAATALASIGGEDLRFDDSGAPRLPRAIARDYRLRLDE